MQLAVACGQVHAREHVLRLRLQAGHDQGDALLAAALQHRAEGVPKRAFWDNEAQMSIVADLFMNKPSFFVWLLQRFYYGSGRPERRTEQKRGYEDTLSAAAQVTTSAKTRDGWRLAATKKK